MKKICPNCGETFYTFISRQKFCCRQCTNQFYNRVVPRNIMNSFGVFKKIVEHAADYNEFKELWQLCGFKEVAK